MSGDDIHFAATHPDSIVLALMPKHQQIKEIYFQGEGGLHDHLARMDREVFEVIIKQQLETIIRFRNGSRILAEVPEPFTIRGHGPKKISIDEMNFIRKDQDLWLSALLPMTLTRTVYINVASTPWNKDSIYWKMCFDKTFKLFSGNTHECKPPRYHLTWRQVLRPNGPLSRRQVKIMREQYVGQPWRWKREMESAFVDDETLVHCEQFPLGTPYVTQMAYIKSICDRWQSVEAVYYDHTGTLGMDEEIKKADFPGLKGVDFSQPSKHGLANFLKQKMMSIRESDKGMLAEEARRQFELPFDMDVQAELNAGMLAEEARRQFELPFDMDVQAELNAVQWEQRPGSEIYSFSHPQGSHDDRFWSVALACVASTGAEPQPELIVIPRSG